MEYVVNNKLITSMLATMASFTLHDIAQLFALFVAIISGLMAIRHYFVSTKLTKLQIKQLTGAQSDIKTKNN